jgi:hypothetical protein
MPDVHDVLNTPSTHVHDVLNTPRVHDVLTIDSYPLQCRDHVPSPGWSKFLRKGDVWEMVRLT